MFSLPKLLHELLWPNQGCCVPILRENGSFQSSNRASLHKCWNRPLFCDGPHDEQLSNLNERFNFTFPDAVTLPLPNLVAIELHQNVAGKTIKARTNGSEAVFQCYTKKWTRVLFTGPNRYVTTWKHKLRSEDPISIRQFSQPVSSAREVNSFSWSARIARNASKLSPMLKELRILIQHQMLLLIKH